MENTQKEEEGEEEMALIPIWPKNEPEDSGRNV